MYADLIITHHPLIFSPLDRIEYNSVTGHYITELIKLGISVYSSHTNFDEAKGGNNDYIVSLLKLQNVKKFAGGQMGRAGDLEREMSIDDICGYVKATLKLSHIGIAGGCTSIIKKIGICCGSAGDLIDDAIHSGCELYITGDVKHHQWLYAADSGICLIDAGHYGMEKFFAENLHGKLAEAVGGKIDVISSSLNVEPFLIR
jgi:dinuclear metal center YbgI/SA1388 family protein